MNQIITVANKEFRDAWRERLLLILVVCFGLLIILSVVTGAQQLGAEVAKYQLSVQQIRSSGQIVTLVPPSFAPLRLLRSSIEYFEILGAAVAIILGYLSISRERARQTLTLTLTRPITRFQYATGKLLGNTAILALLVTSFVLIAAAAIWLVSGLRLSSLEILKLLLAGGLALMYFVIFYGLSAAATLTFRSPETALVVMLMAWVGIVLILPQIGDTMDIDNQVSGGFFASLNLPKNAEKQVLAHYSGYETMRNTTEILSPTKHFERASFALLGIKQQYDGSSLSRIWQDKWQNIITTAGLAAASGGLFGLAMSRHNLTRRNS